MLTERFIVDRLRSKKITESFLGIHSQLNPAIFSSNKMKPAIRKKFVDIVNAFLEYVEVDTKIYDIILVGSNAAYTYNEHSDIDIHIVVDLSSISNPDSIARLYFDSIKKNFKDSYDIKVKGINVELYVEDIKTSSNSAGVYSIMSDEWIKYPEIPNMPDKITLNTVEETKNGYIELINNTENLDDLENILDDLYILRKESLTVDGEFGTGNLLFKALRNEGVLDELKNKINLLTSQELSLESKQLSITEDNLFRQALNTAYKRYQKELQEPYNVEYNREDQCLDFYEDDTLLYRAYVCKGDDKEYNIQSLVRVSPEDVNPDDVLYKKVKKKKEKPCWSSKNLVVYSISEIGSEELLDKIRDCN